MPYIAEQWDSGSGGMTADSSTRELVYLIADAATINAAVALALSEAPESIEQPQGDDVFLQSVDWEIEDGELHRITLGYGLAKPLDDPEEDDFDFNFDTTGGSERITQSLSTRGKYAPQGETAPDFGGAIGVNNDSVEGVDLPAAGFKWTETHYLPRQQCNMQYALKLRALTNRTNAAPFRVFGVDEVIFRGAQGGKKDKHTAAVTFSFEANEHVENLSIGSITGIVKKAWDYLWVRYKETTSEETLVKTPQAVYVEQVSKQGDFGELGIGVS